MTKTKPKRKALLVSIMLGCLVMTGCGMNSVNGEQQGEPGPGERSAEAVFTDFMDAIDDTVQHSGADWPSWDRQDTAGYFPPPCSVRARDDGRAYQTQIEGGPVSDPRAALEQMKAHLESKGYTIGNIFDNMGGNTTGIQLNARSPRGLLVQFTPSKETSFIKVVGECTLDPTAKKRTT